jgi:large subunit ribosomal protein L24
MSISKIQTGDSVKVITGKFKGVLGTITKVIKRKKQTVVAVDNINKLIKYTKSNKAYGVEGKMVQVDRFVDASNVSLVDEKGNISKSFVKSNENKKIRLFRTTNSTVSNSKVNPKEKKAKVSKTK